MKINERIGAHRFFGIPPQIVRELTLNPVIRQNSHQTLNQFLRVMKLTILLITVCLLQVSALTKAQITLKETNTPLREVLNKIKLQTGYDLIYSVQDFEKAKPVSINLKNVSLEKALETAFEGQPLVYEVSEKTVMIKKKADKSVFDRLKDYLAAIDIHARVTDEKGLPLAGASVRVKNTNQAAVTDANGFFTLKGVADDAILVVTFIGYNQKEVKVSANLSLIRLETASSKLDEVQVMAYGTTSRRLSTSNIISVKAADIEKQPVTNPLLALQGRVPGVTVTQTTGVANAGVVVRIQGQNSLKKGSDPLYVIDGVPYASQMLGGIPALGSGAELRNSFEPGNGNPLSFINPSSIESIEILKDADATAIYGSRAAAGAILITTKKGKAGPTRFDINVQSGTSEVASKIDLLNTEQYITMRKEAFKNNGLSIPTSSTAPVFYNYDLTRWDQNRYTDWQKELIGGTARYTDAQATVSGGTTNTQFLLGTAYHKETTVFPTDFANKKASMNVSINTSSANQKFKVQLTASYMTDNNAIPAGDLTRDAMRLPPNAPALYNPDGSLNWAPLANGTSTWKNPLAFIESTYTLKTNNLVGSALLSYQVLPGLTIKSSFGYTNLTTDEFGDQPFASLAPEARIQGANSSSFTNTKLNSWIIEPQVTYDRALGKGTLNALLGGTVQERSSNVINIVGRGYMNDLLSHDLASATNIINSTSPSKSYEYNAIFGRVGYNLLNKFLINITIRRDGSSRFGPQNKFHDFGSVAGAWIFSEERLIKDYMPFLSFGKIRVSYGSTGNDQIGDYRFLNEYLSVSVPVAYQGITGIAPIGIANPNLAWEETRKLQGGIDLGFFKDRILINANYYRNRSSNQLSGFSLPIITGFESIPDFNFPATVQNSGWELMLSTINFSNSDFTWSSSLNTTFTKNKLIAFENQENSLFGGEFIVGQPITITQNWKYLGVNPITGLYEIANKDGKPTTTPDIFTDRTQIINTAPILTGGFQNSFNYKGLQLDFLFQFAKQKGYAYRGDKPGVFSGTSTGVAGGNQPVAVLTRWQKPGDVSSYQKFSTYTLPTGTSGRADRDASDLANQSELGLEDASYIRLKNVALSWNLPEKWSKRIHLTHTRVFLHGQNILTFTKYNGLDPETQSILTLPPLRVFTLGISVGL